MLIDGINLYVSRFTAVWFYCSACKNVRKVYVQSFLFEKDKVYMWMKSYYFQDI